jgi:hypothetical protein
MRFPALKQQLASKRVEIVLEVPTGRELRALVRVRYACPCDDEYLIGIEFESFRDGDAAGWYAYIDWISDPTPIAVKQTLRSGEPTPAIAPKPQWLVVA